MAPWCNAGCLGRGGGSIEPPKTGSAGGLGKGLNSQDHQSVVMNPGAKGAEIVLSIENGQLFFRQIHGK